jgi:hypothetical protein
MGKKVKNIICLSKNSFDYLMESKGWIDAPGQGVSCISICETEDYNKHWFKHWHENIFNLDIDDIGPFWFSRKHEADCYDKSLALYNDNQVKLSNAYFNNVYISGSNREYCSLIHVLDYEEAFALVKWIDYRIKHDDTIYIHCAAGVSRSQGVVRYILDTYGDEYDIKTKKKKLLYKMPTAPKYNDGHLLEVYKNSVWYIDPHNYDKINLKDIMSKKIEPNELVLDKFSWKKSAMQLKEILERLEANRR